MKNFLKVVQAEMIKQHKNYFHSKIIYVSLFIWPIISFISSFYSFKPFHIENMPVPYLNQENLIIFILLGYICMNFFRSLVQSAWFFSFERQYGTLELIYLSPTNRLGVILGNAISSVFESVWVMVVFSGGMFILKHKYLNMNLSAAVIVIGLMMVMAVMWGMLLNALFLFSRDTGFLFTVLEEPMEIFSGVKVPTMVFPLWAKMISLMFPLTYAVEAMRRVFLNRENLYEIQDFLQISLLLIVAMGTLIYVCLKLGERHAKKTGNMALF
ncbi:ABC-2 type transport system permease protein [Anaerosolibacter carboniphilus]|uniref:Transport permease protein n=1 Tax=Anaerosolibacter carboniphilus TaxID=1417629 RepID=A0A841KVT3_9FIRM|nr:ABC transporter permease [Anaerosolibacter carboniphilus]MBB6217477.1 ABC-2 type transport system permease protein [Anaerosolibacter carboniphilus]